MPGDGGGIDGSSGGGAVMWLGVSGDSASAASSCTDLMNMPGHG